MTLKQIANRITKWLSDSWEVEKLTHTDDRLLEDMGIRRRDISRRVREG